MDVASLSNLPVGIRWWHAPKPMLTVIVKATFGLTDDGEAPLATVQEPLGLDGPYPGRGANDLRYASDFAPLKARADVLVVGRVWAAQPALLLPGGFRVDQLECALFGSAPEPTTTVPLVPEYLRANPWPDSEPLRVGPGPLRAEGWAGPDEHEPADYSRFNVAPPKQQVELIRSVARIELKRLVPGVERRQTHLPGLRPKAYLVGAGDDHHGSSAQEVILQCDTLWIDADRALCTLTWRGVVALETDRAHRSSFLAVALQPRGLSHTWETIQPQLGSARWVQAIETATPLMPSAWVRPATAATGLPGAQVLGGARPIDDEAEQSTMAGGVSPADPSAEQPLPFTKAEPTAPAPAGLSADELGRFARGATGVIDVSALQAAKHLPFDSAEPQTPAVAEPAPDEADSVRATIQQEDGSRSEEPDIQDDEDDEEAPPTLDKPPTTQGIAMGLGLGGMTLGGGARLSATVPPDDEDEDAAESEQPITARAAADAAPPAPFDDRTARSPGDLTLAREPAQPAADTPEEAADTDRAGLERVEPKRSVPPTIPDEGTEDLPGDESRPDAAGHEGPPRPAVPPPDEKMHPAPVPDAARATRAITAVVDTDAIGQGSGLPFTQALVSQSLRIGSLSHEDVSAAEAFRGKTMAIPVRPSAKAPLPAGWSPQSSPAAPPAEPGPAGTSGPPPPLPAVPPLVPSVPLGSSGPPAAGSMGDVAGADGPAPEPAAETQPSLKALVDGGGVLPIETYAQIKAALWVGGAELVEVLGRFELDEATWRTSERRQEEQLAAESRDGKSELSSRLLKALVAARAEQSKAAQQSLGLDEWVELKAALETADDRAALLQSRGLSPKQWSRIERDWQKRILGDRQLAIQARDKLAEARRAADRGGDAEQ